MDRLKQIESFVLVAAKGSLTAAAQTEGVAPAVVGRRIDALEERLGVKLLLRTTRRVGERDEPRRRLGAAADGEDAAAARVDHAVAEHLSSRGGAVLSTKEVGERIHARL